MKKKISLSLEFDKLLQNLGNDAANVCLLKGTGTEGWQEKLAWNPCDKYQLDKAEDIENLKSFINKHVSKGNLLAGFLSYDLGYSLHKLKKTAKVDGILPLACFYAYDNYLEKKDGNVIANYSNDSFIERIYKLDKVVVNSTTHKSVLKFESAWEKTAYGSAFEKIKKYIYDGVVYQLNLTQRLQAVSNQSPRELFGDLSVKNSAKMKAYFEADGFEIISMSPERFIRINGKLIETYPIKGTRKRGKNHEEDDNNKSELLNSPKESAELNMITDLMRNDLGKVCKPGTVKVSDKRIVEKLTAVMHTFSVVRGELKPNYSPFGSLLSMFPGGSVTGCPKRKAIEIIDDLEQSARGPYCGSMVAIDKNGNLDSSILIRTIIRRSEQLSLSVGSGIVYDSKLENEYQETLDKARPFNLN